MAFGLNISLLLITSCWPVYRMHCCKSTITLYVTRTLRSQKKNKSFIQIEYRFRFRFEGYFHLPIKIWRYAANLFQPLHSHDLIREQTEQTHAKKPVLVSIQASRSFSIIFSHSRKVRRLVFKLFRIYFRYNFSHLIYF